MRKFLFLIIVLVFVSQAYAQQSKFFIDKNTNAVADSWHVSNDWPCSDEDMIMKLGLNPEDIIIVSQNVVIPAGSIVKEYLYTNNKIEIVFEDIVVNFDPSSFKQELFEELGGDESIDALGNRWAFISDFIDSENWTGLKTYAMPRVYSGSIPEGIFASCN